MVLAVGRLTKAVGTITVRLIAKVVVALGHKVTVMNWDAGIIGTKPIAGITLHKTVYGVHREVAATVKKIQQTVMT
jgi:hypothetical protein